MTLYAITVGTEAVGAATTETLIQGVAGTKAIELVRWSVSFNGVTPTDIPILVELMRFTSAGTSGAFTPLPLNPQAEAAIMTARTSHTVEPVASDVLEKHYVSPAGGLLSFQYAYDERIRVAPTGRLGIRVTVTSAIVAAATMVFDE